MISECLTLLVPYLWRTCEYNVSLVCSSCIHFCKEETHICLIIHISILIIIKNNAIVITSGRSTSYYWSNIFHVFIALFIIHFNVVIAFVIHFQVMAD